MPQLETLRNGKRAAVLKALSLGNTRRAACRAVGVSSTQFYRWLQADEALRDAVLRAEAEAEQVMVAGVTAAATGTDGAEKDWRASAWWLERRSPEFATSATVHVLGKIAAEVGDMTDEQLDQYVPAGAAKPRGSDPGPPGGEGEETPGEDSSW